MFDELFDIFERDGRRNRAGGERRGVRGFFSRMFGGEDDERRRESRYDYDDDDDYEGRNGRRNRHRDDAFDFGD